MKWMNERSGRDERAFPEQAGDGCFYGYRTDLGRRLRFYMLRFKGDP